MARCPAHNDHTPSLSVAVGSDGRILLRCHAGCPTSEVVEALGLTMADLQPERLLASNTSKTEAVYRYTDEHGDLLFEVVRLKPKGFRQRRPNGEGGYVWNLKGVRRVPYRLPEILKAVSAGGAIYIAEGEKDVAALEAAGAVATCNSGGAGKWRDEYSALLQGAEVVIVADKDKPGRAHAALVAQSLRGCAASVCVVEALEGKDAADHLAAGHRIDEFVPVDIGEAAPLAVHGGETPVDDQGNPLVNEAAHTEVLQGEWRGRYRWAEHEGSWRHWTGSVWKKTAETVVVAAAQKVLRRHYGRCLARPQSKAEDERLRTLHRAACRYASVLGGLAFLKGEPGFHTEVEQWDADPYTLNCADGLLDLRTQTLRPHDPEALCTKVTLWSYSETASTGAWQHHLERCLPSADVRRQLQRDLGRALAGADLEESLPIWCGIGANGKSTTERAVQRGIAGYGKKAVRNLLVASKYESHPTEVADLAGARLVFSEEVEDGKHLDEALVKDLTGGSRKKARFMRCDNFEFEQTFTIFLLVNHRPVITGTDTGIWRRVRLVPWTVSIPLEEQRPQEDVVEELVADGSWMLRWMVAGFADWQADHHWVAEEVQLATEAYRAEQDRLGGFLAEACDEKPHAHTPVSELYEAYTTWCVLAGEVPLGKIAFGKLLRSRGYAQKKLGDGSRSWVGICLRTATDGKNSGSPHEDFRASEEPEKLPVSAVDLSIEAQAQLGESRLPGRDDDIPS